MFQMEFTEDMLGRQWPGVNSHAVGDVLECAV